MKFSFICFSKIFLMVFAICAFSQSAIAQPDNLIWARCFGGTSTEAAGTAGLNTIGMCSGSVAHAGNGEFYVLTSSSSADGTIYGNHGSEDVWLAKLDVSGDTIWSKVIGGSDAERAYKVRSQSTGGCVIVGQTLSNNGSFSGNHGLNDGFVQKYTADGVLVWSKLYGGSALDFLYDIVETPEGNLVACGDTGSNDGDLTGTGSGLCWVLWINGANGNVTNSKAYSSTNAAFPDYIENFTCLARLNDNSGYVVSGFSSPSFNDFNADDIFVAKINNSGILQWTTLIGSATAGDGSASVVDAGNGQFYIAGRLSGVYNGVTYHGGNGDAWLIRCASDGSVVGTKNYGGTNWDGFTDMVKDASGNLYMSGFSRSTDLDLAATTSQGLVDFWLVKTDENGNLLSSGRFGGTENDFALGIALDEAAESVVAVGRTESTNGDVSGNNGGRDLWVIKLSDQPAGISPVSDNSDEIRIFPNPVANSLQITNAFLTSISGIRILSLTGQPVLVKSGADISRPIDIRELSSGVYILEVAISGKENLQHVRFVKN